MIPKPEREKRIRPPIGKNSSGVCRGYRVIRGSCKQTCSASPLHHAAELWVGIPACALFFLADLRHHSLRAERGSPHRGGSHYDLR